MALASDAAKDVNGQVFIVRGNEIVLAGQGFPIRGIHDAAGWTPESIVDHAFPSPATKFTPAIGFDEYFTWPIL